MGAVSDIIYTRLVLGCLLLPKHKNVFGHSNEDLKNIFSQINIKDKNVLSVLGSGDQALYFYNNGVRNLDLFDINKFTIYYFYLRMWNIKYNNNYYLEDYYDDDFFSSLLSIVKPKTEREKEALKYWKLFNKYFREDELFNLLMIDYTYQINDIDDLSIITHRISKDEFNFYNVDISRTKAINGKYDIIYTSNISDYLKGSISTLKKYRDNLDRMLEKDGIILATKVHGGELSKLEVDIFSEKFDFYKLYGTNYGTTAYTYVKR